MNRFKNAQVGDEVYCRVYGDGIVNVKGSEFIHVKFTDSGVTHSYGYDGKFYNPIFKYYSEPILFYRKGEDKYLTERPALTLNASQLKMDTLLNVNVEEDSDCVVRYF